MNLRTRSNITWARCSIVNLEGATHYLCSEPSGVSIGERTICMVFVYGRVCSHTTNSSVNWGS